MTSTVPDTIGVIGAGTMGAGIAQLAAQAGARTLLYDAIPEGLTRGVGLIETGLARQVERGRLSASESVSIRDRLVPVSSVAELSECGLVIEAAPERMELKLAIFGELAEVVSADCVLATNTSSLSVTEIAAGVPGPERVVGLHFFNPAPVMKLVEVVAGEVSDQRALGLARAVGEAMGKRVVDAVDIAGFLVNRCNRPFSLEALRLLEEQVAPVEVIDRVARMGGGFRMGPFELMDLIGIETNHAVAESLYRASFGEPRYQPSYLQARMVAAGRLGRKTGSGWYSGYGQDGGGRPEDPSIEPPAPQAGGETTHLVSIVGDLPVIEELAVAAAGAGFDVRREPVDGAWLTLSDAPVIGDGPMARLLWNGSLHALDPSAAGFHLLAPLDSSRLIEVTSTAATDPLALHRLSEFGEALGLCVEPVSDAPGLVLGRIVAQLINEAAFLIGGGNGSAADVDAGLKLGVNHPRGPVTWSRLLSLRHVVGLLDALHAERGEPRYRAAPLLRRRLAVDAEL